MRLRTQCCFACIAALSMNACDDGRSAPTLDEAMGRLATVERHSGALTFISEEAHPSDTWLTGLGNNAVRAGLWMAKHDQWPSSQITWRVKMLTETTDRYGKIDVASGRAVFTADPAEIKKVNYENIGLAILNFFEVSQVDATAKVSAMAWCARHDAVAKDFCRKVLNRPL